MKSNLTHASKEYLEQLISQTKTIGTYVFDDKQHCFISHVEVVLCLEKISPNQYKFTLYYFDGYEVGVEDEVVFCGYKDDIEREAIVFFSQEKFMGYPIRYTNITCEFYDENN